MQKRRRVWWIVVSLVASVALFATIFFVIDYNSTDAKIERAVAQVVEEYGFELIDSSPDTWSSGRNSTRHWYSRASIDEETADEIINFLLASQPSKYDHRFYDEDRQRISKNDGDPWNEAHYFAQTDSYGSWTVAVYFIPDIKSGEPGDSDSSANLMYYIFEEPTLWQRIKEIWPW